MVCVGLIDSRANVVIVDIKIRGHTYGVSEI